MKVKMIKVRNVCLFNPLRPGLLAGIKSRGEGTKNHTFENPLLIAKIL